MGKSGSDPVEKRSVNKKQRPTRKTRRLVLATYLVLLIIAGILVAGMTGLINLPFPGITGRSRVPYTSTQPTTLSPTPTISPATTIPVTKTTPTPTPIPPQPTNTKSPWDISRDFLLEMDRLFQIVPHPSAVEVLLPTSFDTVIGEKEVGELLRQRNELSKQNGLDFSQYMGQELNLCEVMIDDSPLRDGSTVYLVALLVTDTEVVGYWIESDENADFHNGYRVMVETLMLKLGVYTEVYMASGDSILYPYQHRIHKYINGHTEQWDRVLPAELPPDLKTIYLVNDAEIIKLPSEGAVGEETYTLYDDQSAIVYKGSKSFTVPTASGEYTLCLEMSWGTENSYETFQYYFNICKP